MIEPGLKKATRHALLLALLLLISTQAWAARDAAFMAPNVSSGGMNAAKGDEAIIVEPKSEVDLGETPVNVGRRATFFFVNQANTPVEIESITANGDSNVKAEIVGDDCSREKKILPTSRCSVTVEATPIGSGTWTAELLLTHKASGRIARARLSGKTTGSSGEKRELGLSLNTKDNKPVDFGDVEVGTGKAVRTALMVNDSNEVISILSVEIIAADNGLQKLDQGCAPDMDLNMGESCPVTMVWKPETKANVSTDLIIRHSGRLGFAVIPIRGIAKEQVVKDADGKDVPPPKKYETATGAPASTGPGSRKIPMSPTADELESMIQNGNIPPISGDSLPAVNASRQGKRGKAGADEGSSGLLDSVHLIGTVGNRAVLYKPDGTTVVVAVGEELLVDDYGATIKIVNVASKEAEVMFDGKKKILKIETVSALTQRAAQAKAAAPRMEKTSGPGKVTTTDGAAVPLPTGKK